MLVKQRWVQNAYESVASPVLGFSNDVVYKCPPTDAEDLNFLPSDSMLLP